MVAKGSGDSFTLDGTKMFVIDGHTANLIVVAARLEGTSGEDGISLLHRRRRRRRPHPHAARDDGPDPQAGQARVLRRGRDAARRARSRLGRAVEDARPGGGDVGQRDGRRRAEGARDVGRVRQGPRAVRSADRIVPGDQAQVRRHAPRSRVGQVGGVLRGVGGRARTTRSSRSRPAWPRRTAPTPTSTPRPRTSRSTAASASPGSTTRTSTSSGRRAPRSCSATPPTTASSSPSASASDRSSVAHCEPGYPARDRSLPGERCALRSAPPPRRG